MISNLNIENDLWEKIWYAYWSDAELQANEDLPYFIRSSVGILIFKQRIYVPKDVDLRRLILDETHNSKFSIHPGSRKMYHDLMKNFWLHNMKRDIARYMA